MPLVPMSELLSRAQRDLYAVPYCESWNLESLQAVIQAAEQARSPVIAGFNGGFLGHPSRPQPENLAYYGAFAAALSETTVPVAFLLNETDDFPQIAAGIKAGFNAVMVENERLGRDEYVDLVQRVVHLAHRAGVAVEGAIGHLPDGSGRHAGEMTEPAAAGRFVEETGIDALGVAVGNVHILTTGKAPIDVEALCRIRDAASVPLVLHGGTGIPLDLAPSLVRSGVAKINFGTTLKQAYLAAVKDALGAYREPLNPHPFLGVGGKEDVLRAGREAVTSRSLELLRLCGSAGKAWELGVSPKSDSLGGAS